MDQIVIDPLNSINLSLTSLSNSLTTTNTYLTAPAATQSLLSADDALSAALATLNKHQQNYSHILYLRSEAIRLENQIKDAIRQCNTYIGEIKSIAPAILQDPDPEDEEQGNGEVDYQTLLSLASRISTYNTAAQREADASLLKMKRKAQMNGNNDTYADAGADIAGMADVEIARDRAMKGMAFPNAEVLRMGALGRLQVIREQEGEEAVDAEVERLVKQSEAPASDSSTTYTPTKSEERSPALTREAITEEGRSGQRPANTTRSQQPIPERKAKINLDLLGGIDDD